MLLIRQTAVSIEMHSESEEEKNRLFLSRSLAAGRALETHYCDLTDRTTNYC